MQKIYFGGSRHLSPTSPTHALIAPVVRAVLASGCSIHVGCQAGADQTVLINALRAPSALSVFAVAPTLATAPAFVERAYHAGANVTLSAGGTTAPEKARYLLRSKAAFFGCAQALFFQPGAGSLAVAREARRANLPIFAFNTGGEPAPIPSTAGAWKPVEMHSYFHPFNTQYTQVYTWHAPTQAQLF